MGANYLGHQFRIVNSFYSIPWQFHFGPFPAGAQNVHITLNTRCGALHHVGHGTPDFLGSRLSQKSVENCLEGSDGQNLPGVTVNAKMLRKLPPDL